VLKIVVQDSCFAFQKGKIMKLNFITIISIKWTLLVGFNAIISYLFALAANIDSVEQHIAMALGVFTWILIYIHADLYLYHHHLYRWRNSMMISACLKPFTQYYPMIEFYAGALSLELIQRINEIAPFLFDSKQMILVYLTTVLDGFFLTLIVSLFTIVIFFIISIFTSEKSINH
jgi:hypothetical protein